METTIIVRREKQGKVDRRTIAIPTDNPDGFYGEVTLKFEAGQVIQAICPRERLNIEK